MQDVLIALAPSMLVAVYFYGLSAIKLLLVAVIACMGAEFLIQKYLMRTKVTVTDLSAAVTGVLLALNLPPTAPWWVIVIGSVVAIGVAKMTFGGLGHNIFNPALVGRVFLLISFPVIMTDWTVPSSWFRPGVDAVTGATPLALIKEGLAQGMTVDQIMALVKEGLAQGMTGDLIISANPDLTYGQMLFARAGGSAGEASALAIILGFIYLLVRRVIRPHIPVTIILTVAVMTGIFWLIDVQYPDRRRSARFGIHGHRLRDLAHGGQGNGHLRYRHWSAHGAYPLLRLVSRGSLVCDTHYELDSTLTQQIHQARKVREGGESCLRNPHFAAWSSACLWYVWCAPPCSEECT